MPALPGAQNRASQPALRPHAPGQRVLATAAADDQDSHAGPRAGGCMGMRERSPSMMSGSMAAISLW